jgi:hypothetical protein
MAHRCFFRVDLGPTASPYPFRGQFLNVTVILNDTPILIHIADAHGFLIWKSLSNHDNAEVVYRRLLDAPVLTSDTFSFTTQGFAFIFFDISRQLLAFGKDRLGLSTLVVGGLLSYDRPADEFEGRVSVVSVFGSRAIGGTRQADDI